MSERDEPAGHAFISHDPADSDMAAWLQGVLEAAGVRVWRDAVSLLPGHDRAAEIRRAIGDGALVFIACFSGQSLARRRSRQNEELLLAIEQLRMRQPSDPWLIPVRLDDCRIPDIDIGGGRTLTALEPADLFGDGAALAADRVVASVRRLLSRGGASAPDPSPAAGSPPAPGPARRRAAPRRRSEGGEGPFTKVTAAGTVVLVALTYLLLAYSVSWPPFGHGK